MSVEHNRELVHRLVQSVNDQDLVGLADVASGQIAQDAERWIGPFRESFPDFHMEVVDVIAEEDKVMGHFHCSGTHEGEWRGHPPTGRRFERIDEIYVFAVVGGKLDQPLAVVEDNLSRLQQLGLGRDR